jgi:hypothetical protein
MILLNAEGNIIINTKMGENEIDNIVEMKRSVLNLLCTQDEHFANRDENYWAYQLVQLLEPESEQICIKK